MFLISVSCLLCISAYSKSIFSLNSFNAFWVSIYIASWILRISSRCYYKSPDSYARSYCKSWLLWLSWFIWRDISTDSALTDYNRVERCFFSNSSFDRLNYNIKCVSALNWLDSTMLSVHSCVLNTAVYPFSS